MDDIQDSFTQRILRRASQRRRSLRESDTSLNSSREVHQRRYNIIRAINDSSPRRQSCIGINDSLRSDLSYIFVRDSFDLTGIFCNNNNNDDDSTNAYEKSDKDKNKQNSTYKKLEIKNSTIPRSLNDVTFTKIHDFSPVKNNPFENVNSQPIKFSETFDEASEKLFFSTIDARDSNYDDEKSSIANALTTSAVIEMCKKVYTALENNCESTNNQIVGFTEINSTKNVEEIDVNRKIHEASDFNRASSNPRISEITEVTSTIVTETIYEDPNISEDFNKIETEAPTLKSPGKKRHSPEKKILPPSKVEIEVSPVKPEVVRSLELATEEWTKNCEEMESNEYATILYDENEFLQAALGDELDKMSVTYDNSYERDRTHSDFTASDLISEKGSPLQKQVIEALNLSPKNSSSEAKLSGTFDRSMKFYRSLSQRIKNKFRPSVKSKKSVEIAKAESTEEIDVIQELLREVRAQQTLMNEAANSLTLNDVKKDILTDFQCVESERTLLLASLRRKAALEEIKNITSDENNKKIGFREKGEVTVTGISVDLRECRRFEPHDDEMIEWFVVSVTQALKVWISPAICGMDEKTRKINFPGEISIPDLTPGFKIVVQVYSLRLKRSNFHEEKPSIPKHSRSTTCLPYSNIFASPTKLLKKIETHVSPTPPDPNNAWRKRNSSFVLSGYVELLLDDLSSFSSLSLVSVPKNSTLKGSIDLVLSCRLHFAISHQGFLNFYEEVGGFACWNRRWCVLKGHTLMFWNYPREQDIKEPLKTIQLMACVSNEIAAVDRTICAKPRTLLIETERSRHAGDRNSIILECTSHSTFVRNLLSFDSAQELNEWSEKLNHVILALEEWQIIGQRTQPQVSEL